MDNDPLNPFWLGKSRFSVFFISIHNMDGQLMMCEYRRSAFSIYFLGLIVFKRLKYTGYIPIVQLTYRGKITLKQTIRHNRKKYRVHFKITGLLSCLFSVLVHLTTKSMLYVNSEDKHS